MGVHFVSTCDADMRGKIMVLPELDPSLGRITARVKLGPSHLHELSPRSDHKVITAVSHLAKDSPCTGDVKFTVQLDFQIAKVSPKRRRDLVFVL